MIYDFKGNCAASQLHQAGKEIHYWSDGVFVDRAWDLWNRMKSQHEDDWDSDLIDNDDEDVCFTSEFHRETQLSQADILNGHCTLEPSSILSSGQAAATCARELDPYNLPEDSLRGLPEWERCEKLRPIPKGSSKADQETASHLSQNNPKVVHLHLRIHSTEVSGSWVHEIMGLEGIIHLQDLASHLEHDLHLSEPVAPFLPAPNNFKELEIPVLKFLERHTHTTREKLVSCTRGDHHFTWETDYYWTSHPLSNQVSWTLWTYSRHCGGPYQLELYTKTICVLHLLQYYLDQLRSFTWKLLSWFVTWLMIYSSLVSYITFILLPTLIYITSPTRRSHWFLKHNFIIIGKLLFSPCVFVFDGHLVFSTVCSLINSRDPCEDASETWGGCYVDMSQWPWCYPATFKI